MLGKQVNPRVAAVAVLLILAAIQAVYWRLLVYREMGPQPRPGPAGGGPGVQPLAVGRQDVEVETFAGVGPGFQDGPAWQARFSGPNALALAADGALYVADSRNHRIRRITAGGRVSTVAGGGDPGGPGGRADGTAREARFRFPSGVAVAPDGALYVADTGNHRICRIAGGEARLLAGGAEGSADGTGASARFRYPAALHLDEAGVLWVREAGSGAIRRVDAAGGVTTPGAVPGPAAEALAAPRAGEPLQASEGGTGPWDRTPFVAGRGSTGARLAGGLKIYADVEHHVLLAAHPGARPMLIAGRRETGEESIGGGDGQGHRASFALPCAVVTAPDGTAYVAEYEGDRIRRVRLPGWLVEGEEAPRPRRRILRREEIGR